MNPQTDVIDERAIEATYGAYRLSYGVLDSIRFTARDNGLTPITVAALLGLTQYFLEHR